MGKQTFSPSLSLSLGLFQIKSGISERASERAGKSSRIEMSVGGIGRRRNGTSQRSSSLFDACTHYKSLRKEVPTPPLPTPARIIASCSVRGGSKISTFTEMPTGEEGSGFKRANNAAPSLRFLPSCTNCLGSEAVKIDKDIASISSLSLSVAPSSRARTKGKRLLVSFAVWSLAG